MRPFRLLGISIATFALTAAPAGARAQGSPLVDVLLRARIALNELRLREADSLATIALNTFAAQINRDQRVEALSISASARFPEPIEGVVQRPESALVALREIVRLDPEIRLRQDLSWRGLDSLLLVARATTFAPRVRPRDAVTIVSGATVGVIDVAATRPARWRLQLSPASGGPAISMDTLGPVTAGTMGVALRVTGGRPSLSGGLYRLSVVATDSATADSLRWTFEVSVEAPPLELVPAPPALDSATLLPEIAPPARLKSIVAGVLVGALTAVGTGALRGSTDLGSATDADSRAFVVGGAIAIGSIVAGFLDKGAALPANREANLRTGSQRVTAIQAAQAENARRATAYRVTLTVREPR